MERVNSWLREKIWQYGRLYSPAVLLEKVFEAPFDPQHYVDYLRDKYTHLYGIAK